MPTIRWPSGNITRAPDWETLLETIRADQWAVDVPTEDALRREMARRALLWSGTDIRIDGTAEEFGREMARARLFQIMIEH